MLQFSVSEDRETTKPRSCDVGAWQLVLEVWTIWRRFLKAVPGTDGCRSVRLQRCRVGRWRAPVLPSGGTGADPPSSLFSRLPKLESVIGKFAGPASGCRQRELPMGRRRRCGGSASCSADSVVLGAGPLQRVFDVALRRAFLGEQLRKAGGRQHQQSVQHRDDENELSAQAAPGFEPAAGRRPKNETDEFAQVAG